jgi:lipoate-protein ligase A
MDHLSAALNADPAKFTDKAVKSVRSRVTNIREHLSTPMDVMQFSELIEAHMVEKYPDARFYQLSDEDHRKIDELVKTKYGTWEWNFGYSPRYNFRKVVRTKHGGTLEITLDVRDGIIREAKIFGDYFSNFDTAEIELALTGVTHNETAVKDALAPFRISDYFQQVETGELISGLF